MSQSRPEEISTLLGHKGEQAARKEYDLKKADDGREWKDAEYKSTGTPVSIKSAQPDRRFRLFEEAHDILTSQKGWYVFVCYKPVTIGQGAADTRINVLGIQRKKATTVTKLFDSWNNSGHDRGRQKKLQVEAIFDDAPFDTS